MASTSDDVEGENLNAKGPLVDPMPRPLLEALIHEAMASGPDLHIAAARVKSLIFGGKPPVRVWSGLDFSDRFAEKISRASLFNFGDDAIPDSRPIKFFKCEQYPATKFVDVGKPISSDEMTSAP